MKLETLKDLDIHYLDYEEIKEEAIKWVKAYKSEKIGYGAICKLDCVEGWKHFFNITEKDLK